MILHIKLDGKSDIISGCMVAILIFIPTFNMTFKIFCIQNRASIDCKPWHGCSFNFHPHARTAQTSSLC